MAKTQFITAVDFRAENSKLVRAIKQNKSEMERMNKQTRAASTRLRKMERDGRKTADAMEGMAAVQGRLNTALAATVGLLGGQLSAETLKYGAELRQTASAMNLNVSAYQDWLALFSGGRTEYDDVRDALNEIALIRRRLVAGDQEHVEIAKEAGLAYRDAFGQVKTGQAFVTAYFDAIANSAGKSQEAIERLLSEGGIDASQQALFQQRAEEAAKVHGSTAAAAEAAGRRIVTITESQSAAAARLQKQLLDVGQSYANLALQFAAANEATLARGLDNLSQAAKVLSENMTSVARAIEIAVNNLTALVAIYATLRPFLARTGTLIGKRFGATGSSTRQQQAAGAKGIGVLGAYVGATQADELFSWQTVGLSALGAAAGGAAGWGLTAAGSKAVAAVVPALLGAAVPIALGVVAAATVGGVGYLGLRSWREQQQRLRQKVREQVSDELQAHINALNLFPAGGLAGSVQYQPRDRDRDPFFYLRREGGKPGTTPSTTPKYHTEYLDVVAINRARRERIARQTARQAELHLAAEDGRAAAMQQKGYIQGYDDIYKTAQEKFWNPLREQTANLDENGKALRRNVEDTRALILAQQELANTLINVVAYGQSAGDVFRDLARRMAAAAIQAAVFSSFAPASAPVSFGAAFFGALGISTQAAWPTAGPTPHTPSGGSAIQGGPNLQGGNLRGAPKIVAPAAPQVEAPPPAGKITVDVPTPQVEAPPTPQMEAPPTPAAEPAMPAKVVVEVNFSGAMTPEQEEALIERAVPALTEAVEVGIARNMRRSQSTTRQAIQQV